jgi:putative transposase
MKNYLFKEGAVVIIDGGRFHILRLLGDGRVQLESEVDGAISHQTKEELLQKYEQRRLRFSDKNNHMSEIVIRQNTGRAMHSFPENVQAKAIRKKKYLDFILSHGPFNSTPAILAPIIAECGRQLNDNDPPSAITVWRCSCRD